MFLEEEFECSNGECNCADGYVPNAFQTACIKCPGFGDSCYGVCCSTNNTLYCWQGVCQPCVDQYGAWACHDNPDNFLLSIEQVVLAGALLLGVIAVFLVLHNICYVPDIRELNNYENHILRTEGRRRSVSSLQFYIEERLRDAPPSYTRSASSRPFVVSEMVFVNAAIIHDSLPSPSTVPSLPPPYNAEQQPPSLTATADSRTIQDHNPATVMHI